MKSIIPTIILIMGVTMLTVVAGCLISFQIQISTARSFQSDCVDRIQASHFNGQVIDDCIVAASEAGYTLTVIDETLDEDRPCKLVSVEYTVSMPIFGDLTKKTSVQGYAK